MLTLSKYLNGDRDYHYLEHPVQQAVKSCFEDLTNTSNALSAIDGCSAPNFACTLNGLAQSMAIISEANQISSSSRTRAAYKLLQAMLEHPDLIAGGGRACTELMMAIGKRAAIKTGAEAVFVAIIPELKLGDAVLFNFKTVHGSSVNKTLKSRRAFSMRFIGDDVRYIDRKGPTSPPFDGINLRSGDLMREDWFPKIF